MNTKRMILEIDVKVFDDDHNLIDQFKRVCDEPSVYDERKLAKYLHEFCNHYDITHELSRTMFSD